MAYLVGFVMLILSISGSFVADVVKSFDTVDRGVLDFGFE